MTDKQISLGSIYEYFGTLKVAEYKQDVLNEVKARGSIVLDMEAFNNEVLTFEEFEKQYDSIVSKVEPE